MKRLHVTIVLLAVLATVLSAPVLAADALDLDQLRSLAVENSNTLKSSSLSVESQQLDQDALKYDLFPSISTQLKSGITYPGMGNDYTTLNGDSSLGVTLTQPVYQGGVYAIDKQTASVETALSLAERESARLDVLLTVDTLYLGLLEAIEKQEAAQKDLEAANLRLELAEARFEAGMVARTDTLMAKAEAAAAETSLLEAEKNTIIAGSDLASFLGLEEVPEVEPVDLQHYEGVINELTALNTERIEKSLEPLTAAGFEHSPDMVKLGLAREQAELEAQRMMKQYTPSISFSLSDTVSLDNQFSLSNSVSASITGSLTLSQWDRKNTAQQADITIDQAEVSAAETVRLYIQDIQSSWYELVTSCRTIQSALSAEEYAQELYNDTYQRYELNAATVTELSDAEADLSSARYQSISSSYSFLKALAALTRSLGFEDELKVWEILKASGIMEA